MTEKNHEPSRHTVDIAREKVGNHNLSTFSTRCQATRAKVPLQPIEEGTWVLTPQLHVWTFVPLSLSRHANFFDTNWELRIDGNAQWIAYTAPLFKPLQHWIQTLTNEVSRAKHEGALNRATFVCANGTYSSTGITEKKSFNSSAQSTDIPKGMSISQETVSRCCNFFVMRIQNQIFHSGSMFGGNGKVEEKIQDSSRQNLLSERDQNCANT